MATTLERLKQFIDYQKISIRAFEIAVGFSNGAFASQLKNNKSIGSDKIENILRKYPQLDANWLFSGSGEMLARSDTSQVNEPASDYIDENKRLKNELLEARAELINLQRKLLEKPGKRNAS